MRVYLDACAVIYAVEGTPAFRATVLSWLQKVQNDPQSLALTSQLTRLECRVKPLRDGNTQTLQAYEGFFVRPRLRIFPVTDGVIEKATDLRAQYGFKTPDALHLATAIEHAADIFLTGDAGLSRCQALRIELIQEP